MKTICLYFEIHQITHLKRYRFFDIGTDHYYYDDYEEKLWYWQLDYIAQWDLEPTVKTYEFDYEISKDKYDVGKIIFYATEFTLDIYGYKYICL